MNIANSTPPTFATNSRLEAPVESAGRLAALDIARVRADFPVLEQRVYGKPLVYLDTANSSQKPAAVIDAVARFYQEDYSNIHRGLHMLSERATRMYNQVRGKVQRFLNAAEHQEIVFVRGTTEAINLVASSWGRQHLSAGDQVLVTVMEHHSNIVPWQLVCSEKGASLQHVPLNDRGEVEIEAFERALTAKTRFVSLVHVSNALGTVNPVKEMIRLAHDRGIPVLVDGAQSVPHQPVDVQDLDCDFFAFSGHKTYGPSGVGALYGKRGLLEAMPPYMGGGDMIRRVTFEQTEYAGLPEKFEAGTPNIAGVIGLGAALDYLSELGMENVSRHEQDLLQYATPRLAEIEGLRFIGEAENRAGLINFVHDTIHAHDMGTILDREGVAIRAGHHCAQPVMDRFGVPATVRASFGVYNTREDIDALVSALNIVLEIMG